MGKVEDEALMQMITTRQYSVQTNLVLHRKLVQTHNVRGRGFNVDDHHQTVHQSYIHMYILGRLFYSQSCMQYIFQSGAMEFH